MDKCISLIRNNRDKYNKEIMDRLADYSYRMKRYNLPFSIALGFSDEKVDLSKYKSLIRSTDECIVLENNLCCIILDGSDSDSAIEAISHLETKFKNEHHDTKLSISIVTAKDYNDDTSMVDHMFYTLLENRVFGIS